MDLTVAGDVEVELRFKYQTINPEEQLCLYDIDCGYDSQADWSKPKSLVNSTLNLDIQEFYDAYVEYECGYGRGFEIPNWPPADYFPPVIGMWCDDKQNWIYQQPDPSDIKDDVYVENTMPVCKCNFDLPLTFDLACKKKERSMRTVKWCGVCTILQGLTASIRKFRRNPGCWTRRKGPTPQRSSSSPTPSSQRIVSFCLSSTSTNLRPGTQK